MNDSGSVWEAGIIGGYAQMTRKYKSTDYYWGYENDRSVESSGHYYGGSVGYSYFFNGGFGLHLGISTRMVNLGKQKLAEGDSSWNSFAESDAKKDKNLIATNANIGFAYRF